MDMYASICEGLRLILEIISHCLFTSLLERQEILNSRLINRSDLASQLALGLPCLSLLWLELQVSHQVDQHFQEV